MHTAGISAADTGWQYDLVPPRSWTWYVESDAAPDSPLDAGCPIEPAASGQRCAPGGLVCNGSRFMCYTDRLVGPAGIEQCTCAAGAWQCTDTCAAWLAAMTDR